MLRTILTAIDVPHLPQHIEDLRFWVALALGVFVVLFLLARLMDAGIDWAQTRAARIPPAAAGLKSERRRLDAIVSIGSRRVPTQRRRAS